MIALDLSRLLSRAGSPTPTGIDRVELAYARYVAADRHPNAFVARNAVNGIGLLPTAAAAQFVAALDVVWRDGGAPEDMQRIATLARRLRRGALFAGAALRRAMRRAPGSVYLLVSHQGLERGGPIARLKATTRMRFVCLIHDVIPVEFPHLTRPGQARRHRQRLATVGALADVVIANSNATRKALARHLPRSGRDIPVVVAPLGGELPKAEAQADAGRPYFVCIATIEARKNHRLLAELWRRLSAELGDRAPCLRLIGRRGFGSGPIVAQLSALGGLVTEHSDLPDAAVSMLVRGARALLLPSLAEGFGLPVVEALALGVPVLCSDLPALRESGGKVPDYLDPADAGAWHRAILDYGADSPRRAAQLARLARWRPPSWDSHFGIVARMIEELRPGGYRTTSTSHAIPATSSRSRSGRA